MNLCVNSRDAIGSEHGTIDLEAELLAPDAVAEAIGAAAAGQPVSRDDGTRIWFGNVVPNTSYARIRVRDNGCGMKPDVIEKMFEPFFTTKEIGRGTGLGLCTVYGIVKQHQGWIEVASRPGVGTAFSIFLPRAPLPVGEREHNHPEAEVAAGQETILLVEDEAPVRCLTRDCLQRLGYRVLEAASGVEALFLWEQQAGIIDLLLTDMVMPDGISGRDLAGRLRARQPGLPVLCISGYTATQGASFDRVVEGAGFLRKPFSLQTLSRAVRECLDGATAGRRPLPVATA
jgi:CheY-like chemotaxis protein